MDIAGLGGGDGDGDGDDEEEEEDRKDMDACNALMVLNDVERCLTIIRSVVCSTLVAVIRLPAIAIHPSPVTARHHDE